MKTLALSPWTPLLALDRLNSWLRAREPRFCPLRSAFRSTIYWTKRHAILQACTYIGMRRVEVRKPCRICGGSGVFHHWSYFYGGDDNDDGKPCRNCRGTGTARLRFIETTIGPVRWHTPIEKWYSCSLDVYVPFPSGYWPERDDFEDANGWEPDQPGRPLTIDEIHRDLLIVLHAYPAEVCFGLDYQHHTKFRHVWSLPDVRAAERWIDSRVESALALQELDRLIAA